MKGIYKIGTVILAVVCLFTFLTVPVSAFSSTNVIEFKCPISNPGSALNTVYMEVLTYLNGTYLYYVIIYDFSGSIDDIVLSPVISSISDTIRVYFYSLDDINVSRVYSYYLGPDGFFSFKELGNVSQSSSVFSHTFTGDIVGVHYYGFNVAASDSFPSTQQEFVISYASEGLQLGYLQRIFNAISNLNIRDYSSALSSIGNYLDNIEYDIFDTYQELLGVHDTLNDIKDILSNPSSSSDIPDYPVKPNPMDPSNPSSPYDPFEFAPPRQDGQEILDSIQDYEDEIIGDKTPEEIRDEINDNVDFEDKKQEFDGEDIESPSIIEMEDIEGDNNNVVVYNNVFDIVFDCAGGKYRTFVLFNLSIGFAAFVLGRRFG